MKLKWILIAGFIYFLYKNRGTNVLGIPVQATGAPKIAPPGSVVPGQVNTWVLGQPVTPGTLPYFGGR